jgi:methionyl-tRNA formyltransferase
MKTVVFLGSKPIGYRCLDYLIQNKEYLDIQLVACHTNDNKRFDASLSVKELAHKHGIKILRDIDDLLMMDEIDIIISVQYHIIIKQVHIEKAKQIAVNLHMAPLPEYRGCNQFSFAIYQKAKEFGTTIHKMDTGIDSGDILFESRFDIPEGCSVKQLYDLTYDASILLFEHKIKNIINYDYVLIPQENLIKQRGTQIFYRKDINLLKRIELPEDVINRVRATAMPGFEPPYAYDGEKKIFLIPEEYFQINKNG